MREITIVKGEYYYYAKEVKKWKCIEVGEEQSKFIDYKKTIGQFYNHDMYYDKYVRKA